MLASRRLKMLILFAAALVCVTSWHYVYCARQTPRGWRFMGLTYNQRDQETYLTWMTQARAGRFFFDNLYTGEKEKPGYCNVLWWALGTFSRFTGLSVISVYHGSRILFCFIFLLLLDRFIGYFLSDETERWCAFLLISVGAGFGWLLILFSLWTKQALLCADLWVPEAFAFLSMLWMPHLVFSLILQAGIYWLFLAACERGRMVWALAAGLLSLLLGFTHTYHLLTIYVIVLVFAAVWWFRHRSSAPMTYAALVIALSLPALAYFSYVLRICPSMAVWKQQNVCRSPAIWFYTLGFGTVAILPLLFPRQLLKQAGNSHRSLFLLVWVLCNVPLLYTYPLLPFERRLAQGLQIPLTLLSVQMTALRFTACLTTNIGTLYPRIARGRVSRSLLMCGWVIFSALTPLYHLTVTSFRILPPRSPEYLSPQELKAVEYLRRHADKDAVILAPVEQGMWLPRLTERRVFVGHPGLTMNYEEKFKLTARFFSKKMNETERARLLRSHRMTFIYWDTRTTERPPDSPLWVRVFRSPPVEVLRVREDRLRGFNAKPLSRKGAKF